MEMNPKCIKFLLGQLLSSPIIPFVYSPLLICHTLIGTAVPFATGKLIDALAYHQSFYNQFAVLATLLALKAVLSPVLQRMICSRSRTIETNLQFHVLDAAMSLHPSRFDTLKNGELIAKMSRDTFAIGGFVRNLYPQLLQALVMMFAAGFALFTRSAYLTIAFMAFFPLAIVLFSPFSRRFAQNSHRVRRQIDLSFSAICDFLLVLPLLRTLDAERRFANAPQTAFTSLKAENNETDTLTVWFGFLLGLLLVGGEITVLGVAGRLAAKGTIPVGDVVLYQMLFISAIQSIQGIISLLPDISTLREETDSLHELLGQSPMIPGQIKIDAFKTLAFNHVTFAYPRVPDHPIVKDFSALFPTGSIVGLSGINGAGKSTLLKLAVNLLEPQSGDIRFNGHLFREIDIGTFRRHVGIVFQDNFIVNGTIRDNITLRDPAFTQKDIDNALVLTGFDAVVKRLPEGLDTLIGNNVRTLSGGERQRLAIARAVIRNPYILVLDEATNHLDVESRRQVAELVTQLRPGRLILIAGHDPELENLCNMKISCQTLNDL